MKTVAAGALAAAGAALAVAAAAARICRSTAAAARIFAPAASAAAEAVAASTHISYSNGNKIQSASPSGRMLFALIHWVGSFVLIGRTEHGCELFSWKIKKWIQEVTNVESIFFPSVQVQNAEELSCPR